MRKDGRVSEEEIWDERYRTARAEGSIDRGPAAALAELQEFLPSKGRALDAAGGTGRNARWLAASGLSVTLADISSVALAQAAALATTQGLELRTQHRDLSADGFPDVDWTLIVVTYFLDRDLIASMPRHLGRGGIGVFVQPTMTNLEQHERPSARFLLDDGEIVTIGASLAAAYPTVEVLHCTEGWTPGGTHEARLVFRQL